MNVRRIPARSEQGSRRVAAYCRVSTASESQGESFATQVEYYTRLIRSKPEWIFVEVYSDYGISAAGERKRPGFGRMIDDALAGGIDLILVKSISRFSRNLVECQRCVARLKAQGVEVRFEREGISTFDPRSDFIFSLLSAVAQDESRSISDNVKWSYRRRYERGEYCLGNNRMLGYDIDPATRKLVPNADAWIVRRAFELFVEGLSYRRIADELHAQGARRLREDTPLSPSTVRYMLGNEAYVGDRRLQKAASVDFITGAPDARTPQRSYYLHADHPGIIDRATWERAQALLEQRRQEEARGIHRRAAAHHPFYGSVFCGECGQPYTRRTLSATGSAGGPYYHAWNCRERQKGARGRGCGGRIVRETELERAISAELGWAEFDAARFAREVARVEVMPEGIRVFSTPAAQALSDE